MEGFVDALHGIVAEMAAELKAAEQARPQAAAFDFSA